MASFVLLLLTLAGGALSCAAVVVAARRVSRLRFVAQREGDEVDYLLTYEAAKGDPEAQTKLDQQKARHPLLTGLLWGTEPPAKTQNQLLREELGTPALLAIAGTVLSTVAGAASLFVQQGAC